MKARAHVRREPISERKAVATSTNGTPPSLSVFSKRRYRKPAGSLATAFAVSLICLLTAITFNSYAEAIEGQDSNNAVANQDSVTGNDSVKDGNFTIKMAISGLSGAPGAVKPTSGNTNWNYPGDFTDPADGRTYVYAMLSVGSSIFTGWAVEPQGAVTFGDTIDYLYPDNGQPGKRTEILSVVANATITGHFEKGSIITFDIQPSGWGNITKPSSITPSSPTYATKRVQFPKVDILSYPPMERFSIVFL